MTTEHLTTWEEDERCRQRSDAFLARVEKERSERSTVLRQQRDRAALTRMEPAPTWDI